MKEIQLFTDGSVNVQTKIGFGASLIVTDSVKSIRKLKQDVKLKRFENTSSTKLELQTLLWALNDIGPSVSRVIIYTDSQNIAGLSERRTRLEKNNFKTKGNAYINNYKLYREFYRLTDKLDCELVKVRGHQQIHQKDLIHKIFTLVDRASRKALRAEG